MLEIFISLQTSMTFSQMLLLKREGHLGNALYVLVAQAN